MTQEEFSVNTVDKILVVKDRMNGMKQELMQTQEKLIMRDDKMTDMLSKADELTDLSATMSSKAAKVKRKAWWSQVWAKLLAGVFVLLLLYLIAMYFCGGWSLDKCY